MELQHYQHKCANQAIAIRALLIVCLSLSVAVIGLSFLLCHTVMHRRTIILPPSLEKPISVSDRGFDAAYLQAMAIFFAQQRLTTSPRHVLAQQTLLLDYTDPSFYGKFKKQLTLESKRIQEAKFSSVFFVEAVVPDPTHLSVLIQGTLRRWIHETKVDDTPMRYRLRFTYRNGRLWIKSFEPRPTENKR